MKNIQKKIFKSYTKIFGLGIKKTTTFFNTIGINQRNNPKSLKKKKSNIIKRLIKKNLTDKKFKNKLKEIKTFSQNLKNYKSLRNKLKYPCRGQRTHTNAKTIKKINR